MRTWAKTAELKTPPINVVFEYTSGRERGGRFFCSYPNQQAVDEAERKLAQDPKANTKIVAKGLSTEESQRLCAEALAQAAGSILDGIINSNQPQSLKIFEMAQLAFAFAYACDKDMLQKLKE